MKNTLLLIVLVAIFAACEKPTLRPIIYNAEVLNYENNENYCKNGWLIKVGNDTILSNSPSLDVFIGTEFQTPVKVDIEYYQLDDVCEFPYCEVYFISKSSYQKTENNNY